MKQLSTSQERFHFRLGRSPAKDEKAAVEEFRQAVWQPELTAVIFFCSSRYNLDTLGAELAKSFDCPLIGCTTAGEISSAGYQEGGIVGAGLASSELRLHCRVISPLSSFSPVAADKAAAAIRAELSLSPRFNKKNMFAFVLIDGLSMLEEATMASLYSCLEGIPIIGGSSGDDLEFKKTWVYAHGRFRSDAAVACVFETTLPFVTFKTQHFEPTEEKIVITGADPKCRLITEINGEPAAREYARVIGLEEGELNPAVFSENPLLLRIGGEWHVRAIQKLNADGSLSIFSAIEEGLVLTIGRGVDMIRNFKKQMSLLEKAVPPRRFYILCDCILRKLELQHRGNIEEINRLLMDRQVIGFSTYGEQFNSIHVNQTLTGIVIGG